jgi:ribosomal-protein-alanine N-acetyltransferase
VITNLPVSLARPADAEAIATLSKDVIEYGLAWSWTPARVLRNIHDREANVIVARDGEALVGFGIMKYRDTNAHLFLLAVDPARRRQGVGAALMQWLETCAITAGLGGIRLEVRASNGSAIAFYQRLDYAQTAVLAKYYQGTEDAIVFEKRLHSGLADHQI